MGVITVQVLGGNCHLKNGKKVNCLSVLRLQNVSPLVEFKVDEANGKVLTAAVKLQSVVFEEDNSVRAIGWHVIMQWLRKLVGNESSKFLQKLTLSYPMKEFLVHGGIKNKKKKTDLEKHLKSLVSIQCEHSRHAGMSGKPTTILRAEVDERFFERNGQVYCQVCTLNMRETSLDGFLYKDHVLPLLLHLEKSMEEKYLPCVALLKDAFYTTRDQVLFYQHNSVWDSAIFPQLDYKYNDPQSLLLTGVQLFRVVANRTWADFGIHHKNQKNVRQFFQCLAKYRVYGLAEFQALPFLPPCFKSLETKKSELSMTAFRLVVISVFEPSLVMSIFREAGNGYAHVYKNSIDKLMVPGVDSVSIHDVASYKATHPLRTLVAWPAHFFSFLELTILETYGSLACPVILAGTPYVVGNEVMQGQCFTSMVDQGHPVTFYNPTTPVALTLSRQIEGGTYPLQPIPITYLSSPRHTQLKCPTYMENEQEYYHHSLLFTLLSKLSHSPQMLSSLTLVPGPLHFSSDAELALCG